ncbi:glycosyl hydrolase family 18 protein [Mucilaginibacter flavidus]|uniref:glycosyl hydrolase family 18 protein n=1 Tax=Mucilaginibacter flavidus TaxID=2949309 RepID=UPI0020934BCC|nr:glycosyl hydrolase family 18 protein [Mucilaginibacter flavidus]MCO5947501.1 glycosyl hydrolase family 18 protein [Mucilaginibacter flavidus]
MKSLNNICAALLLFLLTIWCENTNAQEVQAGKNFRVIGYLPAFGMRIGGNVNFDFGRINYLNIAFVNPDSTGNFNVSPAISTIVNAAHAKHTKVLISIGGGSAPAYYSKLLSDTLRNVLITNLVNLAVKYNLDGIDVDLEGERIDNNYEAFVTGLSASLKPKSKLITSAVATAYKSRYTDKSLAVYDFINIMSYDKTGPWRPQDAGPHAPYDMAVADLDYWTNTRHIAKDKLSLGLPFYGYGFGTGAPTDINFKNLLIQYPGAENTDQFTVPGGGVIYYNGITTIKNKTTLALQKAGGIMIWQLLGDAEGDKSLLNVINNTISSVK